MNALRGSRLPAATPSIQLESRALTVAPFPECLGPALVYQAPIPLPVETGSLLGVSL